MTCLSSDYMFVFIGPVCIYVSSLPSDVMFVFRCSVYILMTCLFFYK